MLRSFGGGFGGLLAAARLQEVGITSLRIEGKNTGIGFVGTQYPQGAPSFFKMLARWREQGDLAGLIVQ